MLPIGPLMVEHRLIERMIGLLDAQCVRIQNSLPPDPTLISEALDFIRTYADRCHHGKEEDILFRDLARKDLAPTHATVMADLIREHVWARGR